MHCAYLIPCSSRLRLGVALGVAWPRTEATPLLPADFEQAAVQASMSRRHESPVVSKIVGGEASTRPLFGTVSRSVFGRFEADRCNELWTGDVLHGPVIYGLKTYLFAFLDDKSRAVMAARFGYSEDTVRLAAALRPALATQRPGALRQICV
jgi:putative transposase